MTGKKPGKLKVAPKTRAPRKAKATGGTSHAAATKLKAPPKPKLGKGASPKPKAVTKSPAASLALPPAAPYALRQVAALPLRRTEAGLEVLLITSRETHRWVIPKGWPMRKKTDPQAAATEAMQEGGLFGVVAAEPVGAFSYFKRREEHFDLVDVAVYRLDVTGQHADWREKDQREQRWCGLAEAADLVQEPGLKALLQDLEGRL